MSKSQPKPAARDLAELLETRLSPHSIGRIIRSFMETEQWSPRDPVDEHGNCLLVAWLDCLARGRFNIRPPDPDTLSLLLAGRSMSEVLGTRPRSHQSPLRETILTHLGNADPASGSPVLDFFWSDAIFGAIEKAHLEDVPWRAGGQSSPADRRLNILRIALDANRVEVVHKLIDKGWGWDSAPGGKPPAIHINSPETWEAFLQTGGDPFLEVASEKAPARPLWRYLLENGAYPGTATGDSIKEWAAVHAATSLKDKAVEDYWLKIERAFSAGEIMKAIRSRKDWADMKNNQGENVLFVGMRKNLSVVSQISKVAKAASLFSEYDNRGAGYWHHLMARGSSVDAATWKEAIRRANPRANPEKGLLVTLQDIPEGLGQKSLPERKHILGVLASDKPGAPKREDWWAGPAEDLKRLGLYLQGHAENDMKRFYWGSGSQTNGWFSSSDVSKRLSCLLHEFPVPMDAPPELLGGLALNELLSSRSMDAKANMEVFDSLVAAGAVLTPPEDVVEKLDEITSKYFGEEVQSKYRQLIVAGGLAHAPEAKPRSPMRF